MQSATRPKGWNASRKNLRRCKRKRQPIWFKRAARRSVRHVIVAAVGMRDGVPANHAGAALKPNDLALKAIIARQDDAATVQKQQEIAEQFTLGLLGQVISDAMPAEQLARKLPGVSVAGHTADTIGFQQRREVMDHRIRSQSRRSIARCRAAFDLFLKTETDEKIITAYDHFRDGIAATRKIGL